MIDEFNIDNLLQINYFIVLSKGERYSIFSGFGDNIIEDRNLFIEVLKLPQYITELSFSTQEKNKNRQRVPSFYSIMPVEIDSFNQINVSPYPFNVCLVNHNNYNDVKKNIKNWKRRPFIIPISEYKELNISRTTKELFKYVKDIISSEEGDFFNELKKSNLHFKKESSNLEIDEPVKSHLSSSLISNFFITNRYQINNHSQLIARNEDDIINNQLKWNQLFLDYVKLNEKGLKSSLWNLDFILTSPPLYKNKVVLPINKEINIDIKEFNRVANIYFSQKDYIIYNDSESIKRILDKEGEDFNEAFKFLTSMRRKDIELYSNLMSIVFSSKLCPIYRIKSEIDTGLKLQINNFMNSLGKKTNKKCFEELLDSISSIVPSEFIDQIPPNKICKIKLYSDGPLEFLRVNKETNLPLMLEHAVCKVPMTAGNVFLTTLVKDQTLSIPYIELCNVLIIRSFRESAPIRLNLQNACDLIFDDLNKYNIRVKYKIVDVSSIDELILVLNENTSRIVVFDCHGSDNVKKEGNGWLEIGKEKFDIFQYKFMVKVPEIVILSACDTHPLNTNYSSVGNGFLLAGAMTVFATNTSISSDIASLYIARLLYRINNYFPEIFISRKSYPFVTWLEFLSGLQKMMYSSEIIFFLMNKFGFDFNIYNELGTHANFLIYSNTHNWYLKLLEYISKRIDINLSELKEIIQSDLGFTDSMKYIILGNADNIHIQP